MNKVCFYPIGNADCCRIELESGRNLLFDFANYEISDEEDLRINLASAIKEELKELNKDYFDVVAITHADDDHIHGFSNLFYLMHAKKYQDEDRIKINELWVPAALIVEGNLEEEAKILRTEARHRLKEGKGIRVFSSPDILKSWLEENGLKLEDRKHLITDAGQLVPGFVLAQGLEIFVHSPFAERVDGELIDRNESSLIFQMVFSCGNTETNFILIGDTNHEVLTDIVNVTKYHNREYRLNWDIYDVPHHCSYLALSSEKGKDKTKPVQEVKWLLDQGAEKGIIISSSNIIPDNDDDSQPPHRQAANFYKDIAKDKNAEFIVTMSHPTEKKPQPVVIIIDDSGARLRKNIISGSAAVISRPAPRAGGC
jgi:hypothetical protein